MRIAVSGSIADDYLLTFPGRFADMIIPDQLDRLSLSFLADDLTHHRGGIGANIAFGMGQLGARPRLLGAVGADFEGGYRQWLEQHDVDCSGVFISEKATARFLCTTDNAQSQIATFYAGAMGDSHLIDLEPVLTGPDKAELVIVSPASPAGMARHSEQAHMFGVPLMADPSQQLSRMNGEEIRPLIEGAAYLICNDYERQIILDKTGWDDAALRAQVDILITTHGAEGASIEQAETVQVPSVTPKPGAKLEPTGAGDAFRAGLLSGLSAGLDVNLAAHLGCGVATMALETAGPQGYQVKAHDLDERLDDAYGAAMSDQIMNALPIAD